MLDSELIVILGAEIIAGAVASFPSLVGIPLIQKAQPTQQGTATGPSIYFENIDDSPRHWPSTQTALVDGVFKEITTQQIESVYQISSLLWQDPAATIIITAKDLASQIMMWFNSPATIQRLRRNNIGLLRVTKVRNEKFENESHQFEAHPSFDITITVNRTLSVEIPKITYVDGDIIKVAG